MKIEEEKLALKDINIDKESKIAVYGEVKEIGSIQEEIFKGKSNFRFAEVIDSCKGEDVSHHGSPVYEEIYKLKDIEKENVFEIKDPPESYDVHKKDFTYVNQINGWAKTKANNFDSKIEEIKKEKISFVRNYNKFIDLLEDRGLLENVNEEVEEQDFNMEM